MMKAKPTRDSRLMEGFHAGLSYGILARKFGISRERVRQIVQRNCPGKHKGRELAEDLYPRFTIPASLVSKVKAKEITLSELAERMGVSKHGAYMRLRNSSIRAPFMEKIKEDAAATAAEIYDLFIHGSTIKELAELYDKTPGVIGQYIWRHRQRTGAPAKYAVG